MTVVFGTVFSWGHHAVVLAARLRATLAAAVVFAQPSLAASLDSMVLRGRF